MVNLLVFHRLGQGEVELLSCDRVWKSQPDRAAVRREKRGGDECEGGY